MEIKTNSGNGGCGIGDRKQNFGRRGPRIQMNTVAWALGWVLAYAKRPLLWPPLRLILLMPPGSDGELPGHCHGRLLVLPFLGTAPHHPQQHRAHPHL